MNQLRRSVALASRWLAGGGCRYDVVCVALSSVCVCVCIYIYCVQLGGFRLPFISLGSVLLLVGVVSYFVLPAQNGKSRHNDRRLRLFYTL